MFNRKSVKLPRYKPNGKHVLIHGLDGANSLGLSTASIATSSRSRRRRCSSGRTRQQRIATSCCPANRFLRCPRHSASRHTTSGPTCGRTRTGGSDGQQPTAPARQPEMVQENLRRTPDLPTIETYKRESRFSDRLVIDVCIFALGIVIGLALQP